MHEFEKPLDSCVLSRREQDCFLPLVLAANQRELSGKVTSSGTAAASFKENSAKLHAPQLVMTIPGFAVAPTSGAIIAEVNLED